MTRILHFYSSWKGALYLIFLLNVVLQETNDAVGLDQLDSLPVVAGGSGRLDDFRQSVVAGRAFAGASAETAEHQSVGMVETT